MPGASIEHQSISSVAQRYGLHPSQVSGNDFSGYFGRSFLAGAAIATKSAVQFELGGQAV